MNNFKYTLDNKRYHTFNYYLKSEYNTKVAKVILDGGFTCPNRDGSKGYGGCVFCSLKGSGDTNEYSSLSLLEQYKHNKEMMDRKWENGLYIPYFQSFTNTYGPLDKIKRMLEPFLEMDEVCAISIATRSDCISDEVIEYLNSLDKTIWLEIGLQTTNDKTCEMLNMKHNFNDFKDTIARLSKTKIKTCVHIINGLPNETMEDNLKTIKDINHMKIDAIKIHMLSIVKDTKLAELYNKEPFELISREQYIETVVKQLELLKPEVIIERLTGDPVKDELVAPFWLTNKTTILNDIDKLMAKLDTYQGSKYEE